MFPISRDPPEGGTSSVFKGVKAFTAGFQFLGIPPKGERQLPSETDLVAQPGRFQFLGIPPKGERTSLAGR